eukprot:TRINITY_DN36684_c0_g1_i1.p1 TRINITY_DN36684_c0_g1~~TRINITY_DN36684_c0_g1_i1.p1  ORF type:complete len:456 (-),score=51.42 TRINITY_DN36684_c0_g1_i1:286-1653(-)
MATVGPPIQVAHIGPLPNASGPLLLDERTERHLRGNCCSRLGWAICWCAFFMWLTFVQALTAHQPMFIIWAIGCTLFTGVLVPGGAWMAMGQPRNVGIGLLIDFFWWGYIGGTTIAGILNGVNISVFAAMTPRCAIARPHTGEAEYLVADTPFGRYSCQIWQMVQWTLTPGLYEEVFKSIWVLLRIKTKPRWNSEQQMACPGNCATKEVPTKTCLCLRTDVCTCWWRLVETPEAVVLCALAAGAGFESGENIQYMLNPARLADTMQREELITQVAVSNTVRALMFMHILWTGYVGLRMAQRIFNEPSKKPSLVTMYLPVMVIHGLWDWVAFAQPWMNGWLFLFLLLILFILSILILAVPLCTGALRQDARGSVVMTEGDPRSEMQLRSMGAAPYQYPGVAAAAPYLQQAPQVAAGVAVPQTAQLPGAPPSNQSAAISALPPGVQLARPVSASPEQ